MIHLQRSAPGPRVSFPGRFAGAARRRSRRVADSQPMSRKLTALVELGVAGGPHRRAHVRRGGRASRASLLRARPSRLSGIECYEGLQITGDSGRDEIVGRRADAARARCRARLRPRRTLRRSVDHPHRGRLGRVRHRRARSADEAVEAGAHDPAQRLLRHARFGLLQPHAGGREGAQRRAPGNRARAAAGARSLVASAILPGAGAGDPHHGQARRVVRPRDADRRQTLPPGNRRRAAARAGNRGRSPA